MAPEALFAIDWRWRAELFEVRGWVLGERVDKLVEAVADAFFDGGEAVEVGLVVVPVLVVGALFDGCVCEGVFDAGETCGSVVECSLGGEVLHEAFASVPEAGAGVLEPLVRVGVLREELLVGGGEGVDVGGAVGWHRITHREQAGSAGMEVAQFGAQCVEVYVMVDGEPISAVACQGCGEHVAWLAGVAVGVVDLGIGERCVEVDAVVGAAA